jgi:hypothetical protein
MFGVRSEPMIIVRVVQDEMVSASSDGRPDALGLTTESSINVRPMNSVHFPAHVVVIIRRLVNVVSTLSISNQYLLHQQTLAKPDELPSSNNRNCLKHPFDCLKNVEWPWWAVRRNWDIGLCRIDTRREIRNSGMLLKCESTEYIQSIIRVVYFHLSSNHTSTQLAPESR